MKMSKMALHILLTLTDPRFGDLTTAISSCTR